MTRRLFDQDAQREQRRQSMLLDRIALIAEKQLKKEIRRTSKIMLDKYEASGNVMAVDDHSANIEQILKSAWSASISVMAGRVADVAQSKSIAVNRKDDTDRFNLYVLKYLQEFGGLKITQITDTTREQIIEQINIGRQEGLSQLQIAERINGMISDLSSVRANIIARTETHSAGNFGSLEQAKETGLQMQKEWIASGSRARDSHARADGQIVNIDEPFSVGGERLMYPGDPSGSAAETINCRCAMGYVVL